MVLHIYIGGLAVAAIFRKCHCRAAYVLFSWARHGVSFDMLSHAGAPSTGSSIVPVYVVSYIEDSEEDRS